jgi:hypothetical protein
MELRSLVLEVAPELHETVAFRSLCYFKPQRPYGVTGGNVCLIRTRGKSLLLSFLHGAFLPNPDGRLQGRGKAKRHIDVREHGDIERRAFKQLIRAAARHEPGK